MLVKQPSRFITFEGGEGAGKSTQVRRLSQFLISMGIDNIVTREPGGSPGAEEIRSLLVEGEPQRWDPETETLLIFAARREHLIRKIIPTLESGKWVICDRFVDSTYAYQGRGHGLSFKEITKINDFISNFTSPDLTFILDLPVKEGISRTKNSTLKDDQRVAEVRFENMSLEFHERMRKGFIEIARSDPKRCKIIDASPDAETVFNRIIEIVSDQYLHDMN